MSCVDCPPCGTGTNVNQPKPGDPVMNIATITANAVLGGISVRWSYPSSNASAISHTLLFRATIGDFSGAAQIALINGSQFIDSEGMTDGVTYWYWIRFVSVNDTLGPPIGPASAVYRTTVSGIIDDLADQITSTQLHADLRSRISRITDLTSALDDETQNRLFGDNYLSELWAQVSQDLEAVDTLIANEVIERITADSALAMSLNLLLVQVNDNAAAIATESIARADAFTAFAAQITTLEATAGDHTALLQQFAYVAADVDGLMTAEWYIKLDVGGRVSGFGLADEGARSYFLVNADTFAIGHPTTPNVVPFVVQNNTIYMRNAMIQNLAVDTLKIAGHAVTQTTMDSGSGVSYEGITEFLTPGSTIIFMMNYGVSGAVGVQFYDVRIRYYRQNYGQTTWGAPVFDEYQRNNLAGVTYGNQRFLTTTGDQYNPTLGAQRLRVVVSFYQSGTAAPPASGTPLGGIGGFGTVVMLGAKR